MQNTFNTSKVPHLEKKKTSHIFSERVFRNHNKQTTKHRLKHKEDLRIMAEEQLKPVSLHNAMSHILIQCLAT